MDAFTDRIGLADLIKDTIEDLALTRAINAGLNSATIIPSMEFKTNLVQKRKLKFLQSFLDDFTKVKDGKTKEDIFKLVAHLSGGQQVPDYRTITTKDIYLNYARIRTGNSFVCLSQEKDTTILVRIISKKDIKKYFLKIG